MSTATPWTISHDFAFAFGGAERVTSHLSGLIPEAPVQILAGSPAVIEHMDLSGAPTTVFPNLQDKTYRMAAPALPQLLRRRRPLPGNLLSSSYAFSHMIPVQGARVVYCHTPFRQAWSGLDTYANSLPRPLGSVWRHLVAPYLRRHDLHHANQADAYVATSTAVARRIETFYERPVTALVPPPVAPVFRHVPDAARTPTREFLWAGRIVEPYKRLKVAIDAFRQLPGERLRVVGDGRDRADLERTAPLNVTFVGPRNTPELAVEYANAEAVIFPSEDDFGMVMAESIATGTPVIAYAAGGAVDIVEEGVTGVLFSRQDATSLRDGVLRFRAQQWSRDLIAERGLRYHLEHFESSMRQVLDMVDDRTRALVAGR